jgi:hypothetical protein
MANTTAWPDEDEEPGEFHSHTERIVAHALERLRVEYAPALEIAWVPNPRLRLRTGPVMPDFHIAVGQRWGVLEIDGPVHKGKWAWDRSKDMRIEDAGAAYVGRLDVAGTNDHSELDAYLRRLIRLIGGSSGQIAA